jgi:hypothetical protein
MGLPDDDRVALATVRIDSLREERASTEAA